MFFNAIFIDSNNRVINTFRSFCHLLRACVFWSLCLFACDSNAHLNSSGHASVNILEDKAVILINVPLQAFKDLDVLADGMGLTRKIQLQKNEIIRQLDAAIRLSWGSEQGEVIDDQIAVVASSDPQHPILQIEWLRYLKLSPEALIQSVQLKVDATWLGEDYVFNIQRGDDTELAKMSATFTEHVFLKNAWGTLSSFLHEGFYHILTGFDHLLFLGVLLIVNTSMRRWLWVLSSFTLAHGLTYALASQGVIQLNATLIEPIIAFTIMLTAFLQIRNIHPKLWQECAVVFGFGLFHGLGFAGSMANMSTETRYPVTSVLGFNFGIEIGQLLVALSLFIFLRCFKKFPALLSKMPNWVAWYSLAMGSFWMIERIQS
jgi:hydrogenase/urease accessory protein HupE